ncbi:AEC family transporter [Clostridium vitabionis]|uniref:AEC family transporter n=1 Tax=Clostridium vitabionis TaxID=2784388 RepID=UPI00188AF6AB|nr:AEC family transporter [Clostridium vitabionis]
MKSFLIAFTAVMPFLTYLTLGYVLNHRTALVDTPFLNRLNKLVFRVFFPALMFWNMVKIDRGTVFDFRFIGICAGSVIAVIIFLTILIPRIISENPKRSVIIQALYRGNFVLYCLPLTESVFGEKGGTVASMLIAVIVPIYNASGVLLLEMFRGGKIKPLQLIVNIFKNPLIAGALTGFVFFLLRIPIPTGLQVPIRNVAAMTTPLALIVLGGTLEFRAIGKNLRYLVPCIAIRLLIEPVIASVLLLTVLHLDPIERFVYLLLWSTPVATSVFAMAQNMEGDGELAGQFIVLSTVLSIGTLFLIIFSYSALGLLG